MEKYLIKKKVRIEDGIIQSEKKDNIISFNNMEIKTGSAVDPGKVVLPTESGVIDIVSKQTTGHKPVAEIKFTNGQDADSLDGSDATHTGATQKYVNDVSDLNTKFTQDVKAVADANTITVHEHEKSITANKALTLDFKVMNSHQSEGGVGSPNKGTSTALVANNNDESSIEFRQSTGSTSGLGMYDVKGDGVKKFALMRNGIFIVFDDLHKGGKPGAHVLVEGTDWNWAGTAGKPALYTLLDDDDFGQIEFLDGSKMWFVVTYNPSDNTRPFELTGTYIEQDDSMKLGKATLTPNSAGTGYTKTFVTIAGAGGSFNEADYFTQNSNLITKNDTTNTTNASIGSSYKGNQYYGLGASGNQSYGNNAIGKQIYGFSATGEVSQHFSENGVANKIEFKQNIADANKMYAYIDGTPIKSFRDWINKSSGSGFTEADYFTQNSNLLTKNDTTDITADAHIGKGYRGTQHYAFEAGGNISFADGAAHPVTMLNNSNGILEFARNSDIEVHAFTNNTRPMWFGGGSTGEVSMSFSENGVKDKVRFKQEPTDSNKMHLYAGGKNVSFEDIVAFKDLSSIDDTVFKNKAISAGVSTDISDKADKTLANVDNTVFQTKAYQAKVMPITIGTSGSEVTPDDATNPDRRILTEAEILEKVKTEVVAKTIIEGSRAIIDLTSFYFDGKTKSQIHNKFAYDPVGTLYKFGTIKITNANKYAAQGEVQLENHTYRNAVGIKQSPESADQDVDINIFADGDVFTLDGLLNSGSMKIFSGGTANRNQSITTKGDLDQTMKVTYDDGTTEEFKVGR